jgi:GTP-binding protein
MKIKSAVFVASYAKVSQVPKFTEPEYVFVGRSNVGKSSLINMLVNNKGLAKTSSTPGKTRLLNYFKVNDEWHLVDLPGYGYAKVSKSERDNWKKLYVSYIGKTPNLVNVFVLIDSRLPLQKIDQEFLHWLGENGVPCSIIYTKVDKLGKNQLATNIAAIEKALKTEWEELPPRFITSSESKTGREDVLNYIEKLNNDLRKLID